MFHDSIKRAPPSQAFKRRFLLVAGSKLRYVIDVDSPRCAVYPAELSAAVLLTRKFGKQIINEEISLEEQLCFLRLEGGHELGREDRAMNWLVLNTDLILEHLSEHGRDSLSEVLKGMLRVFLDGQDTK